MTAALEEPGFDPARPRYSLELAGEACELVGTFALIEAVEHALQRNILAVAANVMEMGLSDTAKLVAAMLTANGHKATPRQIGEKLFDLGADSEDYAALKVHLYAFLRVMLARPSDRKEVSDAMGEITGKLREASPGATTSDSAWATCDGARPISGGRRRGKWKRP